jgi:hypothetical protein
MVCAFAVGACSSTDLPDGWENAARVKNFVQQVCPGGATDFADERASFEGGTGSIGVDYHDARFRCAQNVEGFFKASGDDVDILVQPIDMHPDSVAGCDCGYNISFLVEPVSSGMRQTTLYRRWDDPDNLVAISTALVNVQ